MIPPWLILSNIRYVSRIKWYNPGKGVASSPTSQCSSYRKGSLRVTLDYGRQLYLLILIIKIRCANIVRINYMLQYFIILINPEIPLTLSRYLLLLGIALDKSFRRYLMSVPCRWMREFLPVRRHWFVHTLESSGESPLLLHSPYSGKVCFLPLLYD